MGRYDQSAVSSDNGQALSFQLIFIGTPIHPSSKRGEELSSSVRRKPLASLLEASADILQVSCLRACSIPHCLTCCPLLDARRVLSGDQARNEMTSVCPGKLPIAA